MSIRSLKAEHDSLSATLVEIGNARADILTIPGMRRAGTEWDNVKPEDFGPTWDFDVTPYDGDLQLHKGQACTVFWPVSKAAKIWAHVKLGDIDRISRFEDEEWQHGFILDTKASVWPIYCAGAHDGLMSKDDYRQAQEEAHRVQWEIDGDRQ